MIYQIFVDGQFGTTGLKIHEMLNGRKELELLTVAEKDKKNLTVKQALINQADLVFLCLPDVAAKETVKLISSTTKVIDASTAHRTNSDWTYGIPELTTGQREKIQNAQKVCVPGCHATGLIMAMNPLIEKQIVSPKSKLICHSITGYSGGGRAMIEAYETAGNKFQSQRPYSLQLNHKHLPEMQSVLGLETAPLFTPSVGNFRQGMLVMSYLVKSDLLRKTSRQDIIETYQQHYKNKAFVRIIDENVAYLDEGFLDATRCNGTNRIEISIYENADYMVIISRLDNLGKGASGAAVQNMNLMLGLDEKQGLYC